MRGVVQRVKRARVRVSGETVGEIGIGLLVFLGVAAADSEKDADYLVNKLVNLRIFEDGEGRMNRSVLDNAGSVLVVSQFTLLADSRRGLRPSYAGAAKPEEARPLYDYFVSETRKRLDSVATGQFQAMMDVEIVNDGPVTILLDSKKEF